MTTATVNVILLLKYTLLNMPLSPFCVFIVWPDGQNVPPFVSLSAMIACSVCSSVAQLIRHQFIGGQKELHYFVLLNMFTFKLKWFVSMDIWVNKPFFCLTCLVPHTK